jgi:hypothetical protein
MAMKHAWGRSCVAALSLALALGALGCKKKKPTGIPGRPDPNSVVCPPPDRLARAVEQDQKGRAVHTACVVFAPGYYWLGAAVSYDPKTKSDVRVHMLTGGAAQRISEVEPLPAEALSALIKSSDTVEARIRKAGSETRLVRMGVMGRRSGGKQPEAEEVGMVLQLVAHAAPKLLWVGAGDEVRTEGGCTIDRTVDFEMPFGNRLEMITSARGKGGPQCGGGPASQQQIESRGVSIKIGRPLAGL